MSETLIIRNFGPIKDITLELKVVNILIGDQGTGKSTVAKVLDILKDGVNSAFGDLYLSENSKEITDEIEKSKFKNDKFSKGFFELLYAYDLKNYLTKESFISYENSFCKVTIENHKIQFHEKKTSTAKDLALDKNTNLNYYIPAYREAYILLRNSYPAILNAKANLPAILNTFGQHFNNYRERIQHFNFEDIIAINYKYINGRDFIILKNGKEISFQEASSAVNSLVPLLVVFLGIIGYMSQEGQRIYYYRNCPFVTIEEPELNCFPSTQNELMKFLIEKIKFKEYQKTGNYYCNLLITTHSPYILSSLNNLMFAYQVGQEYNNEVEKIVEKKYWLNPVDISAHMMLPDGTCESIIDKEGLIKAEKIDSVSTILNKEFNEIFDIELAIKK